MSLFPLGADKHKNCGPHTTLQHSKDKAQRSKDKPVGTQKPSGTESNAGVLTSKFSVGFSEVCHSSAAYGLLWVKVWMI